MNLATNLERSAYFFPRRSAIREGGLNMTYAQLNERASRIGSALVALGVRKGEHVGMCAPNSADWIAFYFGVLKAGAVAVTLAPLLTRDELVLLAGHAKPRFFFTTENRLQDLKPLIASGVVKTTIYPGGEIDMDRLLAMGSATFKPVDRGRKDVAAILYTGGTTGSPKGVMRSHENIGFSAHSIAYLERSIQTDLSICFMPFNHVFGQMHIMNSTIYSAGCLEMLPSFDLDRILELTESGVVTKFLSVPTVFIRLLSVPDLKKKLGKVRYCFSGGASLSLETVKQWKEKTGMTIQESYGQTECMPITFNHFYPEKHVVGSVGEPVFGMEVQIRDISTGKELPQGRDGEICVRGPAVMRGYLNNPEGTKAAFWGRDWLRTGDIGHFDEAGFVYLVDRLKDMIITGGENVYSREVEDALYAIPEIQECGVIGVPDKEWGERVVAYITLRPGKEISADALRASLKARLTSFKVPKEYIVIDDFPKLGVGKVLKRELRRMYTEGETKVSSKIP
ncbi:MAG TPA: class I adenylate-forming enzyme family protein [Syntrophorhabdaceae bacterium]